MDIATQKQLEDLKAQHAPLIEQLVARRRNSVQSALNVAGEEFRSYFESLGFQVSGSYPSRMTAKYQSLEFSLQFDEAQRIGCWAVAEVQQIAPKKAAASAMLVMKGTGSTLHAGQSDPVTEMKREIQETQIALAGPEPQFEFMTKEAAGVGQRPGMPALKRYTSFGEFLRDKFK
ncbi:MULTISPECIES: hypothetical protein [Burkholderia]|uniref:hypothetical protein n=1 Tax=Burkholderia TaxID=32008 RepID=UPI000753A079|nr:MULTISPECIES: hypothetical protein [Burkholderia]AOJ72155.1 hypothetical protein WS78_25790 [Burkholderia savannae]KVG48393.1 hypothetical protein WS77_26720 [Burkholderia sp. MSMB0265]KVG85911.1 hypothetical protein WS81_31100 [Burkholderia sp. MSMB2040]KVG92144.1 hypothetical protein WS82_12620 [Burkholderia sp. MSMB2041]KVH02531.1 hypothetical protein WS83_15630 [Burkholderia sp. MSMB2042]